MKIKNNFGENLDFILEGEEISSAKTIVIYNHGFGTDKHERGIADQIAERILAEQEHVAILRFSYSGYGKSEGRQEDKTLDTMADDLVSVWQFIDRVKAEEADVISISFSLGNQVIVKALSKMEFPLNKMIFVNPAAFREGSEMREKWASRAGVIREGNVMVIPRADGSISRIGEIFWDSLDPSEYKSGLSRTSETHSSILIRAIEDEIVENDELSKFPFKSIYEIHGDHNFSKQEDREIFLSTLAGAIKK